MATQEQRGAGAGEASELDTVIDRLEAGSWATEDERSQLLKVAQRLLFRDSSQEQAQ